MSPDEGQGRGCQVDPGGSALVGFALSQVWGSRHTYQEAGPWWLPSQAWWWGPVPPLRRSGPLWQPGQDKEQIFKDHGMRCRPGGHQVKPGND